MSEQFLASDVSTSESAPQNVTIPSAATAVLGMVGVAQRGPIGVPVLCQNDSDYRRVFGGATPNNQDAYLAMLGFFNEGGTTLYFVRTVHYSDPTNPATKTSAAATLTLESAAAAPTAGSETSANTGPYQFTNGQTVILKFDGTNNGTATFTGTAGSALAGSNGPYTLANNQTLLISVNGVAVGTVTFVTSEFGNIAAATVGEVVAVLNAFFATNGVGAVASASGSAVLITSNRKGSTSAVAITGGTAAGAFAFASTAGTGNVPDLSNVTATQAAAIIQAAITSAAGTCTVSNNAVKLTSATTGGSSSTQVTSSSTAAAELGFDFAVHTGSSGAAIATIVVDASSDGTYGNAVSVIVSAPTNGDSKSYNLQVLTSGTVQENWPNLSMDPTSPRYFATIVNDANTGSQYVALVDQATQGSTGPLPALGTFGPLTGGLDGLASLADADFVGADSVNGDTGMRALDSILSLSLLAVPGQATPTVHNAMVTYCEITRAGQVFAILDPPKNQTALEVAAYFTGTAFLQGLSEYAAFYWPNILVDNPDQSVYGTSSTLVVPPSGAIAGLCARIDAATPAGVSVHPAGTDNGQLFTARGFEMPEVKKKSKRDIVFPLGINPISTEPGNPIFVDGAQVLKLNGNFPSVGQRRLVIFIETSAKSGLAFMRHKKIQPRLYADGQKALYKFLADLTKNEAFTTTDPAQAFSIDFGVGLNPPSVQQAKKVLAKVSLATAPPANWVVIQVSPDERALDQELAAATPVAA